MSFEHARQLPQIDKLGKEAAFRLLQTEQDDFQWWRFAANLGPHTGRVIGDGLIGANRIEHSDTHVILRFRRRNNSTVDVELVDVKGRGIKHLCTDDGASEGERAALQSMLGVLFYDKQWSASVQHWHTGDRTSSLWCSTSCCYSPLCAACRKVADQGLSTQPTSRCCRAHWCV